MTRKVRFKLTAKRKRYLAAYIFALPFVVGWILFFLYPFAQSLIFSFNELRVGSRGYEITYVGLKNYTDALFVHASYLRIFVSTLVTTASDVPLILMFSFFAASLLNRQFPGRTFARMVFFLPVILSSGIVLQMEQSSYMMHTLLPGQADGGGLLSGAMVRSFLWQLRLPEALLEYIIGAMDRIPEIIKASGIQILVFLAGLQAVPSSLYEASSVEGATAWENFWKITFPLMSPLIVTNVVYTIIDSFTRPGNQLVLLIERTAFGGMGFGVSSAMAWMYFVSIAAILAFLVGVISRYVVYQD